MGKLYLYDSLASRLYLGRFGGLQALQESFLFWWYLPALPASTTRITDISGRPCLPEPLHRVSRSRKAAIRAAARWRGGSAQYTQMPPPAHILLRLRVPQWRPGPQNRGSS